MKRFCIFILIVLAAGFVFAETPEKVSSDADALQTVQQGKSDEYHLFLQDSALDSYENRDKLNDYRARFNAITGKIIVSQNQIATEMKSRSPNTSQIQQIRQRMQGQVDEHDKLLAEYKDWVTSLK